MSKLASLTPRELQTLEALRNHDGDGRRASEELGISPKTLAVHKAGAFRKLGVHTTVGALRVATERGLFDKAGASWKCLRCGIGDIMEIPREREHFHQVCKFIEEAREAHLALCPDCEAAADRDGAKLRWVGGLDGEVEISL